MSVHWKPKRKSYRGPELVDVFQKYKSQQSKSQEMTDEQVQNWRKMLCGVFGLGPYALIMPKEEIIALRDRIQKRVDLEERSTQNEN